MSKLQDLNYLIVLIALFGCEPDVEGLSYETPRMQIYTDFSEPLCQGNLDDMEGFIDSVEHTLGVEMPTPLEVYLWNEGEVPVHQGCSEDARSCYRPRPHRINSTFNFLYHELAHAAVADLGNSTIFLSEGLASAMEPRISLFKGINPAVQWHQTKKEARFYGYDGHFTRWLLDTYGPAPWRKLYEGRGSERDFEKIYGISLSDASDQYLETSVWAFAQIYRRSLPTLPTGEFGWYEEVEFDCSGSDALGYPEGISIIRVLDLKERGYYDVWTSADGLRLERRPKEPIGSKSEAEAATRSDLPISTAEARTGSAVTILGGQLGVLQLEADEYEVALIDLERDLERATVVIVPHLGPLNQTP